MDNRKQTEISSLSSSTEDEGIELFSAACWRIASSKARFLVEKLLPAFSQSLWKKNKTKQKVTDEDGSVLTGYIERQQSKVFYCFLQALEVSL